MLSSAAIIILTVQTNGEFEKTERVRERHCVGSANRRRRGRWNGARFGRGCIGGE